MYIYINREKNSEDIYLIYENIYNINKYIYIHIYKVRTRPRAKASECVEWTNECRLLDYTLGHCDRTMMLKEMRFFMRSNYNIPPTTIIFFSRVVRDTRFLKLNLSIRYLCYFYRVRFLFLLIYIVCYKYFRF